MPAVTPALPSLRVLKTVLIGVILLVLGATVALAHPINATRLTTSFFPEGTVTGTMEIDLVYFLEGSEEYYRISQLPAAEQEERLRPILDRIQQGVWLRFGERTLHLEIGGFKLPEQSLAEYLEYRTKSMTVLELSGTVPPGGRVFSLNVDPDLPIEYPVIFHVFFEAEQRRFLSTMAFRNNPTEPFSLPQSLVRASEGQEETIAGTEDEADQGRFSFNLFGLYVKFGFLHIVPEGLDHILFVLGLFFLRIHWKPLLAQVTAFTIAHSITLGLSVYGLISLPMSVVEPLVLLSIVFVAVENVVRTSLSPWRVGVVFGFGLLHGLGFAGFLAELGIPSENFLMALLSFNIGVELGQLAVIAMAFVAVGWWRDRSWYRSTIALPASVIIAAIGLYWTGAYIIAEL
jgi:hypothetical protein